MSIIIGRRKPRPFSGDDAQKMKKEREERAIRAQVSYSEREKELLLKKVGELPEERRVDALRSNGLLEEADMLERTLAERHLSELRKSKLEDIMSLPEAERLPLLIENGFDEEAKALSEHLNAVKEEEPVSDDASPVVEETVNDSDVADVPKRRAGRPKKNRR